MPAMKPPQLIAETFSPWSEKARWALDHHRIAYRFHEYVPMLEEPWLRLRLGAFTGRVSVPALVGDDGTLRDSFAIAEDAERKGGGAPLFPTPMRAAIAEWNARSERALQATRVRVIVRMGEVRDADLEALPPYIPGWLRPLTRGTATMGVAFLRRKYDLTRDLAATDMTLRAELGAWRDALGGRPTLGDAISYADITMAVTLQGIRPVADSYIPLGPATREVWSNDELAREVGDLLEWRDALYAKHRRPASVSS